MGINTSTHIVCNEKLPKLEIMTRTSDAQTRGKCKYGHFFELYSNPDNQFNVNNLSTNLSNLS